MVSQIILFVLHEQYFFKMIYGLVVLLWSGCYDSSYLRILQTFFSSFLYDEFQFHSFFHLYLVGIV